MIFCGDPKFIPQLSQNKFILNLANNHILNYSQSGLEQTKFFLSTKNISFFNSHYPETEFIQQNFNGIKFGFLGFDLVSYPKFDQNKIIDLIKKYNSQVDWLIVSVHWGNEYQPQAEAWRINLAHLMIDAGADLIHGHHPHVLQNIEFYQGKPIYYSLGNFIFDQNWSQPTSTSEFIQLTVDKNKIIKTENIPFTIKNNSRPQPN
jgi:poly-gamma-glutamate synthesis protein (capsule biosynthesis protein)